MTGTWLIPVAVTTLSKYSTPPDSSATAHFPFSPGGEIFLTGVERRRRWRRLKWSV